MVLKSNLALEQNTQVERISAYRQQPGLCVRIMSGAPLQHPTSHFKLEIPTTPMSYLPKPNMTNSFSLEKERRERERKKERRLKPSNPRKWILPAETPL
jgi:hypothetical protein